MTGEADQIRAFARCIANAEIIEVHSGDREPGTRLTETGKAWVVAGLELLAIARSAP